MHRPCPPLGRRPSGALCGLCFCCCCCIYLAPLSPDFAGATSGAYTSLTPHHAHVRRVEHVKQVSMGSARGLPPLRMAAATCKNEEKACPLHDCCSACACKFASGERERRHPRRAPRPFGWDGQPRRLHGPVPVSPAPARAGRGRVWRPLGRGVWEEKKRE
jgi:hypothetical protein